MAEETKVVENQAIPCMKDIANWFLLKGPTTNKALQKLCYYAQAWSLVFLDEPIASNAKFEAWVHGPVNRDLWKEYKDYGWKYFELEDVEATKKQVEERIDDRRIKVLNTVWDAYGDLTADELEILSHSEEPWIEKRRGLGKFQSTTRKINEKTMKEFYSTQID